MRSREFGGVGGNTMGGGSMMAVCLMLVELGIDLSELFFIILLLSSSLSLLSSFFDFEYHTCILYF